MNWKVYEKWLKPHEPFTFYYRGFSKPGISDGVLTSIADLQYPCPSRSSQIWHKHNNSYERIKQIDFQIVTVPNISINPKDIYDYVTLNFEAHYDRYIDGEKDYPGRNLFIILKKNNQYVDVGIALLPAKGKYINEKVQKYIESYHRLKAFA